MNKLSEGLKQLGLSSGSTAPDSTLADKLMDFIHLIHTWNQAYNLTAIRSVEAMVSHHILDSLSVEPFIQSHPWIQSVIDIGTGAGLPGIPLAMCFPEKQWTLLDSVGKKIRFCEHACRHFHLSAPHVKPIHARVETYVPDKPFDLIITRAFSDLNTMLRLSEHLLADNGLVLAMKGRYPTEELLACAQKNSQFKVVHVQPLVVPFLEAQRHMICLSRSHHDL